jgi:hypothetical protein
MYGRYLRQKLIKLVFAGLRKRSAALKSVTIQNKGRDRLTSSVKEVNTKIRSTSHCTMTPRGPVVRSVRRRAQEISLEITAGTLCHARCRETSTRRVNLQLLSLVWARAADASPPRKTVLIGSASASRTQSVEHFRFRALPPRHRQKCQENTSSAVRKLISSRYTRSISTVNRMVLHYKFTFLKVKIVTRTEGSTLFLADGKKSATILRIAQHNTPVYLGAQRPNTSIPHGCDACRSAAEHPIGYVYLKGLVPFPLEFIVAERVLCSISPRAGRLGCLGAFRLSRVFALLDDTASSQECQLSSGARWVRGRAGSVFSILPRPANVENYRYVARGRVQGRGASSVFKLRYNLSYPSVHEADRSALYTADLTMSAQRSARRAEKAREAGSVLREETSRRIARGSRGGEAP